MNKYYYEGKTKEQAEELALEELKVSKEDLIINSAEEKKPAALGAAAGHFHHQRLGELALRVAGAGQEVPTISGLSFLAASISSGWSLISTATA